MNRRKFLTRVVGATAGLGAVAIHKLARTERTVQNVSYKVKGFTCITCAIGLEVMLMQQPGVVQAHASYPEATVVIGFDESRTSEAVIREFITGCGFSVS